jgi:hypothetical protein
MVIATSLCGFLFLLILGLNFAMTALGYPMELGGYDVEAELQKISSAPRKFKIRIALALIEHVSIIALAILLFIVFGPYSMVLGILWITTRIAEGLIHTLKEVKHWGLLELARQFSVAGDADKRALRESGGVILQAMDTRFTYAMILWSIGTLAYSILFICQGLTPPIIGWLGVLSSVSSGIGHGIRLARPDHTILIAVGGLSAILFEVVIGGWLLASPLIG